MKEELIEAKYAAKVVASLSESDAEELMLASAQVVKFIEEQVKVHASKMGLSQFDALSVITFLVSCYAKSKALANKEKHAKAN